MRNTLQLLNRLYRRYAVLASMMFAATLCLVMLACRIALAHNWRYSYLAWNLFLAWLPLVSAFAAFKLYHKPAGIFRVLCLVFMGVWLLFLPNAPYLVTDLIHLPPHENVTFWFDLTMFVAYAVTGLLFGLVSLYWMQQIVSETAGSVASWIFVLAVSALSSFGIYLGRFQHWNSWDILSNPTGLLMSIGTIVRHPIANYEIYAFSAVFTLFLIATYFMLSTLTRLPQENESSEPVSSRRR